MPVAGNKNSVQNSFGTINLKKSGFSGNISGAQKYSATLSKFDLRYGDDYDYEEIDYSIVPSDTPTLNASQMTTSVSASTIPVDSSATPPTTASNDISFGQKVFNFITYIPRKLWELFFKNKWKVSKDNEFVYNDNNRVVFPENSPIKKDTTKKDDASEQEKNKQAELEAQAKKEQEEKEKKEKEEKEKKEKEEKEKKEKEEKEAKEKLVNEAVKHAKTVNLNIKNTDIKSVEKKDGIEIITLNNGTEIKYDLNKKEVTSISFPKQDVTYYYKNGVIIGSNNNDHTQMYTAFNDSNRQFGGNQDDFSYNLDALANDPNILNIISRDFGTTDPQAVRTFLSSIPCCGCNYTAVVNSVFNQYRGREQDFYNDFGFPMYTVDKNGNIDYNYEPVIVEIYSHYRRSSIDFDGDGNYDVYGTGNIWDASRRGADGLNADGAGYCYNHLKDKYGLSGQYTVFDEGRLLTHDEVNSYIAQGKTVILCTNNYSLVNNETGQSFVPDGHSGHAMVVTGYDEYNRLHVSTWGNDYVVNVNEPGGDKWAYYEIIG